MVGHELGDERQEPGERRPVPEGGDGVPERHAGHRGHAAGDDQAAEGDRRATDQPGPTVYARRIAALAVLP